MVNNWEALPPRKRNRGRSKGIEENISNGSHELHSSSDTMSIDRKTSLVEENIQTRVKSRRLLASLDSKDGCAGDFFEYLDHTADVQFHVWGDSLSCAIENIAPCMFNYITDLSTIEIDSSIDISVKGHDLQSLIFEYMEELLFRFSTEGFMSAKAEIVHFDEVEFSLSMKCMGSIYDPQLHPQGTEIKAITYSNMQIHQQPDRCDIYVIVDI